MIRNEKNDTEYEVSFPWRVSPLRCRRSADSASGWIELFRPNIIMLWVLLSIAGALLVIYTFREKPAGKLKTYLLVAGFSAAAFFPGVLLHNLLYALGTLMDASAALHALINILEGVFFLGAVILCPIGECVGVIGTLIHWRKHEN